MADHPKLPPQKKTVITKFRKCDDRKFECLLCNSILSTKQRVLSHLHAVHDQSPLKRQKKLYLDDNTLSVPKRTLYRWNEKFSNQQQFCCQGNSSKIISKKTLSEEGKENKLPVLLEAGEKFSCDSSFDSHTPAKSQQILGEISYAPENSCRPEISDTVPFAISESDTMIMDEYLFSDDVKYASDEEGFLESNNTSYQSSSNSTNSDSDSIVFACSASDCESTDFDDTDSSFVDTDSEDCMQSTTAIDNTGLPKKEFEALSLISCFLRNKFSASTSKDVINTFKSTFSYCKELSYLRYEDLMSYVDNTDIKEFHYCVKCNGIFPLDEDIFQCATENCDGLRYKGEVSNQQKKGRQPIQCFVFTDIRKQLTDLLQTPGIWENLQQNKEAAYERKEAGSTVLTDITDGALYRAMMEDGGFLDKANHNLTAIFNTDGVNLYASSKIELWPIFLAINELSPELRFSRNNIILLGMWQGKGKPPFQQFFGIFVDKMNSLFTDGVEVHINQDTYIVKLSVLLGIADLPAKAELLNMTYFNGTNACITCEEPGISVRQGKGHSKCYPYRDGLLYQKRSQCNVSAAMNEGSDFNRCKGFKGTSPLINLQGFDIVNGTVPEYMHGVLLGITKTLLGKWFSPSQSRENYFIGKHIKVISKRMNNIKPPHKIERLPRDLEKHYMHFKATELQSWLLYYSIPCLKGFLGDEYMENLVLLSDAIYILLGDEIKVSSLEKAADLLLQFYASFQQLYGDGSCGLNVHNAAYHLPEYVKMWGPIWCWSCFPFEDANAMLLQAVHGTGRVLKQVVKYVNANLHIRTKGLDVNKAATWKISVEAKNCDVAGATKQLQETERWAKEQLTHIYPDVSNAKRVDRIIVNEKKFFSADYNRMKKRICNVVSYAEKSVGVIKYFIMCENVVFAVISKMEIISLLELPGAFESHLTAVRDSKTLVMVNVNELCDVLMFIKTSVEANNVDPCYVCKLPNRYGHAVFK